MEATKTQAFLRALDGMRVEYNVPMRTLTTLRIGGPADFVLYPSRKEDVVCAVQACAQYDVPLHIMGNGSNILVRDDGVRGLVLVIGEGMDGFTQQGRVFTVGAGLSLSALARETLARGMQGLEWAAGIPGTVGGACAMNAGAYGGEIKQTLQSVCVIEGGAVTELTVKDADMGYRQSAFAAPARIVLGASFLLSPDDGHAKERQAQYAVRRREKQPLKQLSAGSTFKRPAGHYAGALIEGAGLKGVQTGGAQVSELHAGFLINTGNATASDMLRLIALVQERVYKIYGVELECELKIW